MRERKNFWTLLILLMSGIVFGGFLGQYLAKYPSWGWLNYGLPFGMTEPLSVELQIIQFTIGVSFKFTIAGILGMIAAGFIYKRI